MQYAFGNLVKLTSLDLTQLNTTDCKNFTNIFENDNNLVLYIYSKTQENLKEYITQHYPNIEVHDTYTP